MRSYTGGVFSNCGTHLNGAFVLVGMDDSSWKLKGSWDQIGVKQDISDWQEVTHVEFVKLLLILFKLEKKMMKS